nr:MAG TPA: structural protein [Caudoviricetes sp.]
MKFGVREICDVVLKAKAAQKIGNKIFYAGEPVCYFDTLKTSSMEGAATTVYAQGGRGNARLVAWEGERTVTFTMEDALISPEGFMILSGAGLIDATGTKPIYQHMTETIDTTGINPTETGMAIHVSELPYMPKGSSDNFAYVMLIKNGEIVSEPHIPEHYDLIKTDGSIDASDSKTFYEKGIAADSKPESAAGVTAGKCIFEDPNGGYWIYVAKTLAFNNNDKNESESDEKHDKYTSDVPGSFDGTFDSVIVDYYVRRGGSAR